MNYEEAMSYIQGVQKSGVRLGLVRMEELCRRLKNPEKELTFIHVAGTNGKGSTAVYISSILAVNGYMTGRYVSPTVFCYEECIQYEDPKGVHYIDKELLAEVVGETAEAAEAMVQDGWEAPTVFEIETAMAFLAFVRWQCKIVVLETGMGGREDATNVVENVIASVITPISRDHMPVLGDTPEEIAAEKAGIIKPGGTVITYQPEDAACEVIRQEAKKQGALVTEVKEKDMRCISASLEGSTFSYRDENYRTVMPGIYQIANACLAIEACKHLPKPFMLNEEQIMLGVRMAEWRGRFEVICTSPLIIIDGAHNLSGAQALLASVRELLPDCTLHGIMGVYRDKEYGAMVETLSPAFADVVTITAPGERGLDCKILAEEWERNGCPVVSTAEGVSSALKEAISRCKEGDAILIFGTLSVFKDLKWKKE